MQTTSLSKWFFIGILAVLVGVVMIWKSRKSGNKNKTLENGYMLFILGLVGVISEFTDFATVLLFFVLVTGVILLLDRFVLAKRRSDDHKPHYVYYSKEFFPVVLGVWVLRSFLFEAYQIPSSSMRPDLTVGDFILVNKFSYGFRMPITNQVVIPVSDVERGDIVVFEDQEVRNRDLIKRVIGLPGDTITYTDKKLTINGHPLEYQPDGSYDYNEALPDGTTAMIHTNRMIENLTGVIHPVITDGRFPPVINQLVKDFPNKQNCSYNDDGFSCKVPAGHYFMMGDNRDNSLDSRYWGFVPENAIFGKAIYVWMNFHDLSRIGTKIK